MAISKDNPLLWDFTFPPYDIIQPHHIVPGIQSLLTQLENELIELESKIEPTWPKLVVPLERIIDRLDVVWGVIDHLSSVKDSPQFRAAIELVQPQKVDFQLRLRQSKSIYEAFKNIRESSSWDALSSSQKRVVEGQLKTAILGGVSLEGHDRERFTEIQQELAKLALKFEANVLDSKKLYEKLITDKDYLKGLPATTLALSAKAAASKGHEEATAKNGPWLITLDPPIYRSVMQHAQTRSLREEIYRAYIVLASTGDHNNTPLIEKILKLRLEMAKLLGYKNYAELSMAAKMATVDQAKVLIEKLRISSWGAATREMEDLKNFAKAQNWDATNFNHWDLNFWGERLREASYDIKEEELRPYLSLPNVMDGLFSLTKMLFDVDISPADGHSPVWNEDVKFYCVKNPAGYPIAYFYLDPYSRPSEKRGGAWVSLVAGRSLALSRDGALSRLPIVNVVCNQTPPLDDKPSLMTFQEVETIFHEFGHALQIMLTTEDEGFVSGNRGIEWDAIEVPSSFMENWCYQRALLTSIAKHYETGESLPEEVCAKLQSTRTFRAASVMLRQMRYAGVDLALHSEYIPGGTESVFDVDQRIGQTTNIIPLLLEDKFLCIFSHIFADEYAAGYYSYQWAEVMSYDAFSAFDEAGLDNPKALKEIGRKFRDTILALGGGKAPLEVFVEFRGREPSPKAFLRYLGLSPTTAVSC